MRTFLLFITVAASMHSFAGWHQITGNGILKTENRDASAYTSLASGGPMNVEISYGNSNTIKLEGEENILPYVETEVKDNQLIIKIKQGYSLNTHQPLKVFVSMTILESVAQSGSGNITGDGNFSNSDNTLFALSGSGSIHLTFASFASISIRKSGSGSIDLSGKITNDIDVKQSGSGNTNLDNVACNNATVQLSGSGNIRIHADKALTAQISGSGNVFYSGDATVASKVSGSGRLRRA